MKRKTFDLLEVKTDEDGQQPGSFSALASVFGNVDHMGDRVMPGAFKKTLKKWRESGRPLPVILSHQWENPFATVGSADPRAVMETEDGLLVQGLLDIADNDTAKQVHKLMKKGLMTGWSFGYTVPDDGEKVTEDGVNEITEIDLVEVGPTLKGANAEAQLQAVKSALDVEAPPKFQKGGLVPGSGSGDKVPVMLSPGTTIYPTTTTGAPTATVTFTRDAEPKLDAEESPAEVPSEEPPEEAPAELPLSGEALEKAIEESDRFQEAVAARVEERLKAEREQAAAEEPPPDPSLTPEKVETVESEKPAEPVKPAAKADPLKDEIDRLRLEIAVGKRL